MWMFRRMGASGFSASSTAEKVARGIDGSALTAIVTGASSGIGMETARALALCGVHVIMADCNVDGGKRVKERIINEAPHAKIDVMELDLSSLASIRKFASDYNSSKLPLNILINNAGIMGRPFTLSRDNIELHFAINHIGHFLLTNLLLDNMKRTAQESQKEGRIVTVSSSGHRMAFSSIRFDKINDASSYNMLYAYAQSKLANILHANEIARRLKREGVNITANSVHPGATSTNILRIPSNVKGALFWITKIFIKTIPQGAATSCYVALHPKVNGVTGEYFAASNISKASALARNMELGKKLWDFSMNLTEPK